MRHSFWKSRYSLLIFVFIVVNYSSFSYFEKRKQQQTRQVDSYKTFSSQESAAQLVLKQPNHNVAYNKFVYSDEKDRIFPKSSLKVSNKMRYFPLFGFNFCPELNESLFDSSVFIHELNGTVVEVNPPMNELIDIIDKGARRMYDHAASNGTYCRPKVLQPQLPPFNNH